MPIFFATVGGMLFALNGTYAWLGNSVLNPVAFLPMLVLGIEMIFDSSSSKTNRAWYIAAIALALSLYAGFPEVAYMDGLFAVRGQSFESSTCLGRSDHVPFDGSASVALMGVILALPILVPFDDYLKVAFVGGHTAAVDGVAQAPQESLARSSILTSLARSSPMRPSPRCGVELAATSGQESAYSPLLVSSDRSFAHYESFSESGPQFLSRGPSTFSGSASLESDSSRQQLLRFRATSCRAANSALFILAAFGLCDFTLVHAIKAHFYRGGSRDGTRPALMRERGTFLQQGHDVQLIERTTSSLSAYSSSRSSRSACCSCSAYWTALNGRLPSSRSSSLERRSSTSSCPPPSHPSRSRSTTPRSSISKRIRDEERFLDFAVLYPNWGTEFGLNELSDIDLPFPRAFKNLLEDQLDPGLNPGNQFVVKGGMTGVKHLEYELANHFKAYEDASVKYLLMPSSVPLNPRLAKLGVTEVFHDSLATIYKMPTFRPFYSTALSSCTITSTTTNEATVDCPTATTLIRTELSMKGWKAFVNGKQETIVTKDHVYQQITVPAGVSTVTFTFSPPRERDALIVAVLGGLFLVGSLINERHPFVPGRRRRRPGNHRAQKS